MSFNDIETARIRRVMDAFLAKRRPAPAIRHQVDLQYSINGQSVEITEVRPAWDDPSVIIQHPVAKTTYVRTAQEWRIFWMRGNLKWHRYELAAAVKSVEAFAEVVERDEACCFFG
jgi:hypothetical protein